MEEQGSGTIALLTSHDSALTAASDQADLPVSVTKDSGRRSVTESPSSNAASSDSSHPLSSSSNPKPHSLSDRKDDSNGVHVESAFSLGRKQHGPISVMKRFLKIRHKANPSQLPPARATSSISMSGLLTRLHKLSPSNNFFADEHPLQTEYGQFGKLLGTGGGGSIRLVKRKSDGLLLAVKQFHDRRPFESERVYSQKIIKEFCTGSRLHHENIIETLDLVHEGCRWYEVMEYAPFDLFAIVMTGEMTREEIACSFLQIMSGVMYLHGLGLAHRDLKLENVVVSEHGIMKLIDFGCSNVYKYPLENGAVLASGIVEPTPYLAPEAYGNPLYEPYSADIWSLAIIFASMSLGRFPWNIPYVTDESYKLFMSAPTAVEPAVNACLRLSSEGNTKLIAADDKHDNSDLQMRQFDAHGPHVDLLGPNAKIIEGPWRLLRLLPSESRGIVGKMLEVVPRRRASFKEIMEDPWVSKIPVCRQVRAGKIIKAPGHEHTLELATLCDGVKERVEN